ncbi:MAG: PLDc N-terminal domain-containing protein [Lachnospiraceae bacterium]|nr:PLDc N-terminal domain-containing protein [Lachnospiraceae bacterium]
MEIKEILPFLIPLIIIEFGLMFYVIRHILTHNTYKRDTRGIWLLITIIGCEFIGPILYLLLGKEEE